MAARQRSSGAQALAQEMGIASLLQKSESGLSTISEVFRRNFSQTMDQVEQELHSVIDPSGDPYPDPCADPMRRPLSTPLSPPPHTPFHHPLRPAADVGLENGALATPAGPAAQGAAGGDLYEVTMDAVQMRYSSKIASVRSDSGLRRSRAREAGGGALGPWPQRTAKGAGDSGRRRLSSLVATRHYPPTR